MKHLKTYNESIRDKMTPIKGDELSDAIEKVFGDSSIPLDEYSNSKEIGEFKEISELIGEPLNKLYFVSMEESGNFEVIHDFFASILDNMDGYKDPIIIKKDRFGDSWYCYPESGMAYWYNSDFGGVDAWIYSKKIFDFND